MIKKSMRIRIILCFVALSFVVTVAHISVSAEENLKAVISKEYASEKDICSVVKSTLREGYNAGEITRACIQMGHDACLVVRCAVEADGNLEQIIAGALAAGATSDVCAKCAIDGGAAANDVSRVLETGLGYSPPASGGLTPVEIGLPGGNTGGGVLSPSGFK